MSPKRFGKSRLAPRIKSAAPAGALASATADTASRAAGPDMPNKPRTDGIPANPSKPVQTSSQMRPARVENSRGSGNPAKKSAAAAPVNTQRTQNPPRGAALPQQRMNSARPGNAGPSASAVKSGNPAKPGIPQNRTQSQTPQSSMVSRRHDTISNKVAATNPSNKRIASGTNPVNQQNKANSSSRIRPSSKRNIQNQPGSQSLKVIALGGLREIGKNMFVLEYGDDMIIIDCGIGFPEENMPGIDVVIPDMSYVFQRKSKVRGVFFTHGHEDHIGAVSWLLKEVQAPLYASKLTLALIKLKLEDRGGTPKQIDFHPIEDGDVIQAGCFSVEFIHTNHSIADANLLAIRTPVGIVIHTGDFKIDYTPINGDPISIPRIAAIGEEKPLLLLCESTNVEKPGFSMSESKVGESFINIFEKAQGRIFVATFSSNIYRMQQIFTAAERFNRKVCLVGRSIVNVFQVANSLGYMTMKPGTLVDINQIKSIPADQLVIISTGSQGEPMSALTRIAFSEHQKIEIHTGDTVIISASPIPGNEKPIYRVINELFLKGADVIYASLAEVHASGHAYQEELKLMHQLVRPKYFVPVHGEYRMLYQHSLLAQKMGTPKENSFLLCNGDVLELTATSAKVSGYVPAEGVLIDGSSMGDVGNLVLRERKLLSDDGVISVSLAVDRETGLLVGEPNIQARGFIYESEAERIIDESQNKIQVFIKKCSASNKPLIPMIKSNALRDQLRDFLFDRTRLSLIHI